jgi:hypothetical protein
MHLQCGTLSHDFHDRGVGRRALLPRPVQMHRLGREFSAHEILTDRSMHKLSSSSRRPTAFCKWHWSRCGRIELVLSIARAESERSALCAHFPYSRRPSPLRLHGMPLSPLVSSTQVVVDDRNPAIVYNDHNISPGGRPGSEFNDTTTGLGTHSSASFSFQGTSSKFPGSLESEVLQARMWLHMGHSTRRPEPAW